MAASEEINQAGAALIRATTAVLTAKDEHEDLRETVDRLEHTVLDLVKEVRDLREGRQTG
jgi:hypothetical protein